jgi:hypothetical protein
MKLFHEHRVRTSLIARFRQRCGTFGLVLAVCLAPIAHHQMVTASHCPHDVASNHCVWHCDGVDAQALTGRSHGVSVDPAGFIANVYTHLPRTSVVRSEILPRGPPVASLA